MFLEEIIGNAGMEDSETEYKAILDREDVVGWLKTIAGFSNGNGGDFYIGVEDKSHKLIGFDRNSADRERNYFNNQVNEHLIPRPAIVIKFLRYMNRKQERYIIHVQVQRSAIRPVVLKYKGIPAIYMRRDGFTNGATYEEIISMSIKSQHAQFDTLPSDRIYKRSDFEKLAEFYSQHNDGKECTEKLLRSIGFYDEHGVLANGAVLFADDYAEPKTDMMCSVFSGFNKGSERIVTVNRIQGNLTDTIQYACDFVAQRMNRTLIKGNDGRMEIDAYPQRAVLEGVINAIAHRDYFLDGTQIQIDMLRDRLEISSPGSFYLGAPIGKTYDLSSIISKRRNELICSVLVACKVMEAAGTGFDKITEEYALADDWHKPYILSTSDHFTLVLPDLTYTDGADVDGIALQYIPVPNGTKYDEKVLSYCFSKAHKASEIAEQLGISDSTYFRSKVLKNLVEEGYLLTDKQSRTQYYRTNPEMVRLG